MFLVLTQVCGQGKRRDIETALAELCSRVSDRYPDALPIGNQMPHSHSQYTMHCASNINVYF